MEFSGKMPELPQFGEVGVEKNRLSVISVVSQPDSIVSQPDRRDIPVPLHQQKAQDRY